MQVMRMGPHYKMGVLRGGGGAQSEKAVTYKLRSRPSADTNGQAP